jgi:AcrR family transcriptional regulator
VSAKHGPAEEGPISAPAAGSSSATARPGRKRSEASRQAILAAAAELTAELGYGALTVEKIAQRAGAGKQTIYRWWPSKADVVMDALAAKADLQVRVPEGDSLAADLRAALRGSFALARRPEVTDLLRALMAEAQIDPEFAARFRAQFLHRRRRALRVIFDRAAARGDLPPAVPVDTLLDVVLGTLWYRVMAVPAPLDDTLADELTALIAGASRS